MAVIFLFFQKTNGRRGQVLRRQMKLREHIHVAWF